MRFVIGKIKTSRVRLLTGINRFNTIKQKLKALWNKHVNPGSCLRELQCSTELDDILNNGLLSQPFRPYPNEFRRRNCNANHEQEAGANHSPYSYVPPACGVG